MHRCLHQKVVCPVTGVCIAADRVYAPVCWVPGDEGVRKANEARYTERLTASFASLRKERLASAEVLCRKQIQGFTSHLTQAWAPAPPVPHPGTGTRLCRLNLSWGDLHLGAMVLTSCGTMSPPHHGDRGSELDHLACKLPPLIHTHRNILVCWPGGLLPVCSRVTCSCKKMQQKKLQHCLTHTAHKAPWRSFNGRVGRLLDAAHAGNQQCAYWESVGHCAVPHLPCQTQSCSTGPRAVGEPSAGAEASRVGLQLSRTPDITREALQRELKNFEAEYTSAPTGGAVKWQLLRELRDLYDNIVGQVSSVGWT